MRVNAAHPVWILGLLVFPAGHLHAQTPERGPVPRLVDRSGDPLPPGAVARLGTTAFRHARQISAAAVSPDGRFVATASEGRAIYLWDATTGRRVRDFPTDTWRCPALAFSPDSRMLAAAGDSGALYDVASGRRLAEVKDQENESYLAVAFSPDSKRLALGTAGHVVTTDGGQFEVPSGVLLLNSATGRKVRRLGAFQAMVTGVAFSPDGASVAACTGDKFVRQWHASTGKELRPLAEGEDCLRRIAFSADGKRLATGGSDGHVALWDSATGTKLWRSAVAKQSVGSLQFSPDGSAILVGADYSRIGLIDARSGRPRVGVGGLAGVACHGAFAPDGKAIVAWGEDHTVHIWQLAADRELSFGDGHRQTMHALVVSPDGRTLASTSYDQIRLWNLGTGRETTRLAAGGFCDAIAFSPDGKTLAGIQDWGARMWDLSSGRIIKDLDTGDRMVSGVTFAPDGKSLYTAGFDSIEVWDVRTGKRLRRFEVRPPEPDNGFSRPPPPLSDLAVSRDGKLVAVTDVARVRLWNSATGKEVQGLPEDLTGPFALSPDGRTLACDRENDVICFWDVVAGKEVGRIKLVTGQTRHSLAFAPDGRTIAGALADGVVRVWSCPAGLEVASFQGHQGQVSCVTYTPDGKAVLSGGFDTTILMWDLGKAGRR